MQPNIPFERAKTFYIVKNNIEDKKKYGHPTIKEIEIIENLIKNSAQARERAIVLDPFVGSGTHCLAAKHCGCDFIGFEINEKYYNTANDRLNGIDQNGNMNLFDL